MTSTQNQTFDEALDAFEEGLEFLGLGGARDGGADGFASLAFGSADKAQKAGADRIGIGPVTTAGSAKANASAPFDDAAAYGLLIEHLTAQSGGASNQGDTVTGSVNVRGTTKAEGRGLSIGLQEFLDPDETDADGGDDAESDDGAAFGPGPEDFLPIFDGVVDLGGGDDSLDGFSFVQADAGDDELIFAASNGMIVDRDSALKTGGGSDLITATGRLAVTGPPVGDNDADGPSAGDADLEAISDGLENVGLIDMGGGADRIEAVASVRSVSGATAIADGIDNSSVGNPNPVFGGTAEGGVRLLMGGGNDVIEARGSSVAEGDGAIANGMDTRSLVDMGSGSDRLSLAASATFIDTPDVEGEQEEAIADGLENRGTVLLGNGSDTLEAKASATGNGVLTIADGIDSRGNPDINGDGKGRGVSIDAGTGNDTIRAEGRATATAPVPGDENAGQKVAKTIAGGLLTENADAGLVLMGSGSDTVELKAVAKGRATDTGAFALSNVSFDIPNTEVLSGLDLGTGNDLLEADAVGAGDGKVAAYGIWGGETTGGNGNDRFDITALVSEAAEAQVIAINLDDDFELFGGTGAANAPILSNEGAILDLGTGADVINAVARAQAGVLDAFVAGIFLGEAGVLDAGDGTDEITAIGTTQGPAGEAFAIFGEETGVLRMGSGNDMVDASRGGFGGGFTLDLGTGSDLVKGFGEVRIEGGAGRDTVSFDTSLARFLNDGGEIVDGTGTADFLLMLDGAEMAITDVEVFDFDGTEIAAVDLLSSFEALLL
ncbi:MAG: hypothetical protein ACFBRM_12455 [Pikeienuella sp.]